uniref:Large ribosomal subunit protein uL13c n=1 Tax=Sonderella linearis TaxID=110477 RepID=A0A1Z1MLY7_9FLOR|nr:ribosomal protein L13 [Sonderella linearis]ARW67093.1 ribosomal protein L13 [Sonderella linearis]
MFINKNETHIPKINNNINWYIIDAKDKTLGRLSSKIASILKGKNNISYTSYQENNIKIIVINSAQIKVTGNKNKFKTYKKHSGKPGGLKIKTFNELQQKMPNKIIEHSIKGMLPKNSLGRKLFKKLKVYSNTNHPHDGQQPIYLEIN